MTDQLQRSLAAKRRQATGRRFEQRLDAMHASYEVRKLGKIVPHYPRTVLVPGRGRMFAKGGAPVDYSGVLRIPHTDADGGTDPRMVRAVAFDAKVMHDEHASYTHPKEQRHQLLQLMGFHRGGALAFLLFEDRVAGQLVVVHGLEIFDALLSGEAIRLRGEPRWPRTPVRTGTDYEYRSILHQLLAPVR